MDEQRKHRIEALKLYRQLFKSRKFLDAIKRSGEQEVTTIPLLDTDELSTVLDHVDASAGPVRAVVFYPTSGRLRVVEFGKAVQDLRDSVRRSREPVRIGRKTTIGMFLDTEIYLRRAMPLEAVFESSRAELVGT